jgi:MYXO-CTERM domain-containing protein
MLAQQTDPPTYVQTLRNTGVTLSSAVVAVLRKYIPMPSTLMGVSEAQFYANLQYYWNTNTGSNPVFDPVAATAALEMEVLQPMDQFKTLFERNGYLTRLATFISPEEMNKDPEFVFNSDLPEQSNVHTGTAHVICGMHQYTYCEAPVRVDMPEGGSVWYKRTNYCSVDLTGFDTMPSLAIAWQRAEAGEGQAVIDNRTAIGQEVAAHNSAIHPGGCGCNVAPVSSAGAVGLLVGLAAVRRRRRRERG